MNASVNLRLQMLCGYEFLMFCEVTAILTFDHQTLICSFLSPSGGLKFPQGILETSRSQEWAGRMKPENTLSLATAATGVKA